MRTLLVLLSLMLGACTLGPDTVDPETAATSSDNVVLERVETEAATFRVVEVIRDLEHPWAVTWLPDGRMLVTERPGRLNLADDGSVTSLDGLPEIAAENQGGLLDVAVHPNYERNGWIYFTYSTYDADDNMGTVLTRARLSDDETALTDREVVYEQQPFLAPDYHFGSRIRFHEDGTLYVTMGERGQRRERTVDIPTPTASVGTTVRLNPDGTVPDDNPFVGDDEARPEVYTYGHRNQQGMAIHPQTGVVWQHEHGPHGGDEINFLEPGNNYGWPAITWGDTYSDQSPIGGTEAPGMEQPVTYWDPSIAPSGMAFYTGDQFPEWQNQIFLGALAHQHIRRVVLDGTEVVAQEELLRNEIGRIRDVRTGPDGYLYALTDAPEGSLYRLEPVE